MAEKSSKKSKRPEPKSKMRKKEYQEEEEIEEFNHSGPVMEQQQETVQSPPLEQVQKYLKEDAKPMKLNQQKFASEPFGAHQRKIAQSLPAKVAFQQTGKINKVAQQQYQADFDIFDRDMNDSPPTYSPLPPITSIQNVNEIFQTKLQSFSMKAFKVSK
jgi:hypothetical protein